MSDDENLPYLSPIINELVPKLKSYPGWVHYIAYEVADDGAGGWHLFVVATTPDSIRPGQQITVRHGFLIPAASYNRNSWVAWLRDRLADVNNHELGEFFTIDGVREFAPHHGNGEDPYVVWHMSDYETAKKSAGDD